MTCILTSYNILCLLISAKQHIDKDRFSRSPAQTEASINRRKSLRIACFIGCGNCETLVQSYVEFSQLEIARGDSLNQY